MNTVLANFLQKNPSFDHVMVLLKETPEKLYFKNPNGVITTIIKKTGKKVPNVPYKIKVSNDLQGRQFVQTMKDLGFKVKYRMYRVPKTGTYDQGRKSPFSRHGWVHKDRSLVVDVYWKQVLKDRSLVVDVIRNIISLDIP